MRAPYRTIFNPEGNFIVRKPTSISGRRFERLETFDKTLVSERRLRQMFSQRTIVYDGENPGGQLSNEEAAKTFRGQMAARAQEVRAKRAKEKAEKLAAEAKAAKLKAPKAAKPKAPPAPPKPTETVVDPAAIAAARAAVVIPADWATISWPTRLQIAAQLTTDKVKNGADAAAAIEAELARRGNT